MLGQSRKEFYRSLVTGFMLDEVIALTGVSPTLSEFDRAWDAKTKLALRQKSMLADMLTYLPEDVLVKVDRAAMSVSLETRAPFLDHRVLEFALRLPVRFVKDKHLLKQMLFKRVPRELLEREKKGFAVPLAEWFRLELRDLLESMLTKDRIAAVGLRNYGMVRRYMDEHQAGVRNHSYRLWALLMLVMWKQTHP
jgi:asparagine synthase (glutamine-hydrolysing)